MRSPIPSSRSAAATPTYHPAWDKVYGNPSDPATSIVFGEKGAGKTAMRLQMTGRIALHNAQPQNGRLFVIEYDDFNPFLDHFADRLSARKQRDPATRAGRVEAVGPHGRDPLARRDEPGRSPARRAAPDRPRRQPDQRRSAHARSTATRSATCCCWPRATTTRTRENVAVALAPAAPQAAASHTWRQLVGPRGSASP